MVIKVMKIKHTAGSLRKIPSAVFFVFRFFVLRDKERFALAGNKIFMENTMLRSRFRLALKNQKTKETVSEAENGKEGVIIIKYGVPESRDKTALKIKGTPFDREINLYIPIIRENAL